MPHETQDYWVVIPAAGMGSRFSSEIPKQYIKIHHKTVLEHTLSLFLPHNWIRKIVVTLSSDDLFFKQLPISHHPKVTCVIGGDSRQDSVSNALSYLKTVAQNEDWVLVHDAVRPCLHQKDLSSLLFHLKEENVGGILAAPVHDTIKFVVEKEITQTVNRENLWHALTPQMFRLGVLTEAYNQSKEFNAALTDDASAIEQIGLMPKVVRAQYPNPKLTYERDFAILSMLLTQKEISLI